MQRWSSLDELLLPASSLTRNTRNTRNTQPAWSGSVIKGGASHNRGQRRNVRRRAARLGGRPVGMRAREGRRSVIGPLPTMAWLLAAEYPAGDWELAPLPRRTDRRQRNGGGSKVARRHEPGRGIISEWQSSEPLVAIPRGRIPVPSTDDIRRRTGLRGGARACLFLIMRRRLV